MDSLYFLEFNNSRKKGLKIFLQSSKLQLKELKAHTFQNRKIKTKNIQSLKHKRQKTKTI